MKMRIMGNIKMAAYFNSWRPGRVEIIGNSFNKNSCHGSVHDRRPSVGTREHVHLRPEIDISASLVEVIIGRLDAKGTGVFNDRFIPSKNPSSL
jgi:hypothetical protein